LPKQPIPNKLSPLAEQARAARSTGYRSIHLMRQGQHAVVEVEVGELWIPVIRELYDGNFSHIVEPVGIEAEMFRFFSQRKPLFEFASFNQWHRSARTMFAASGCTSDKTICFDILGCIVDGGRGFESAVDRNAYPIKVYATWEDPV
jgi:hypothetical protein